MSLDHLEMGGLVTIVKTSHSPIGRIGTFSSTASDGLIAVECSFSIIRRGITMTTIRRRIENDVLRRAFNYTFKDGF